jgi:hypothetical protein
MLLVTPFIIVRYIINKNGAWAGAGGVDDVVRFPAA